MTPSPPDNQIRSLLLHPLILPLYVPSILFSTAMGLMTPVMPLYVQSYNAPYAWIGLVLAADGLGLLVGDIPAGVLLNRFNRRTGMMIGIGIVGSAILALSWARSIPEVFLFRLLAGIGAALYNVSRSAYVAETIKLANRGRGVALLGGTFRLGRLIGPIVAGSLALSFGLRAPFPVAASICALAVVSIASAPRRESTGVEYRRPSFRWGNLLLVLRQQARSMVAPGIGHFLMQMVRAGPAVVLPLYGTAVLGLNVQQIGWIFGAASAIDMTLFYPTGMIMDRAGRKWAIVPSAALMALGLAIIPFTHSFLGLTLAAMLNGFGNGLGSGVMITLGADLAPPHVRGEFLGVWNLIGDSGITGGPILVGAVADVLALQPAAWVIASTGFAASLVFLSFVPETLEKVGEIPG